jgi:hypothetical protein
LEKGDLEGFKNRRLEGIYGKRYKGEKKLAAILRSRQAERHTAPLPSAVKRHKKRRSHSETGVFI